jgi:hypothetical protein
VKRSIVAEFCRWMVRRAVKRAGNTNQRCPFQPLERGDFDLSYSFFGDSKCLGSFFERIFIARHMEEFENILRSQLQPGNSRETVESFVEKVSLLNANRIAQRLTIPRSPCVHLCTRIATVCHQGQMA